MKGISRLKLKNDMALFDIYTYQFSPLPIQGDLFDESYIHKQEVVMENKNNVFKDLLQGINFTYRNKRHSICHFPKDNELIVFKISNTKTMLLERDFKIEATTDEPSSLVIIYNSPYVQRIAIQQNLRAFSDTEIVVRIIQNSLKHDLAQYGLRIAIKKEYRSQEFWDIVNTNMDSISMLRFEFDYPNLPRVTEKVDTLLRGLSKGVYSGKTKLEFNALEKEALNLNRDNEALNDLTKAASSSGNPITLKIKGYRKYKKTGNTTKTVEFDEAEIISKTGDELRDFFNRIDE